MGQETVERGATYRAARLAVIILSILLAVGMILVAIGFMRQYGIYRAGRDAEGAPAVLRLKPGAHIVGAETRSGRLILHVATPKGGEVEIMDLASGKLISRTKPR